MLVLVSGIGSEFCTMILRMVGVTQEEEEVEIPSEAFAGMSSSIFFWAVIGKLFCVWNFAWVRVSSISG